MSSTSLFLFHDRLGRRELGAKHRIANSLPETTPPYHLQSTIGLVRPHRRLVRPSLHVHLDHLYPAHDPYPDLVSYRWCSERVEPQNRRSSLPLLSLPPPVLCVDPIQRPVLAVDLCPLRRVDVEPGWSDRKDVAADQPWSRWTILLEVQSAVLLGGLALRRHLLLLHRLWCCRHWSQEHCRVSCPCLYLWNLNRFLAQLACQCSPDARQIHRAGLH